MKEDTMWSIVLAVLGLAILAMVVYAIAHPHQTGGDFYEDRQKNRDDAMTYLGKHPRH